MLSSQLLFFSFSGSEVMLILFVALILFGGDKFPEIARGLGKGIREFKDMSDGVKREIHSQINNYDVDSPKQDNTTPPAIIDPNIPPAYTAEAPLPVIDPSHELQAHDPVTNVPEHQVASLEHIETPTPETPQVPKKPDFTQPPNTISHQSY